MSNQDEITAKTLEMAASLRFRSVQTENDKEGSSSVDREDVFNLFGQEMKVTISEFEDRIMSEMPEHVRGRYLELRKDLPQHLALQQLADERSRETFVFER